LSGAEEVRGRRHLDVQQDLAVGVSLWRGLAGAVLPAVYGHIGGNDLWQSVDLREKVEVRLRIPAAEFQDPDHSSAGKAGREVVGCAEVRHPEERGTEGTQLPEPLRSRILDVVAKWYLTRFLDTL
jgi:hypothetical protein